MARPFLKDKRETEKRQKNEMMFSCEIDNIDSMFQVYKYCVFHLANMGYFEDAAGLLPSAKTSNIWLWSQNNCKGSATYSKGHRFIRQRHRCWTLWEFILIHCSTTVLRYGGTLTGTLWRLRLFRTLRTTFLLAFRGKVCGVHGPDMLLAGCPHVNQPCKGISRQEQRCPESSCEQGGQATVACISAAAKGITYRLFPVLCVLVLNRPPRFAGVTPLCCPLGTVVKCSNKRTLCALKTLCFSPELLVLSEVSMEGIAPDGSKG